ncbi:MAG: histidine phosphatase family protein [Alphaproteobacteria bacterium]|nr:histidine phosphatase family protein [Alphaproteobacteria bacterium]
MGRSRWIGHAAFARYIDDYQAAGLDGENAPPQELCDLLKGTKRVYASELERSIQSARTLLPQAELVSTPLFTESPLASPPVPGIRLKAPAWAVISRVAWHSGFKPGIESYGQSKHRARKAVDLLISEAEREGIAVLVAHGYFNAILGRTLRLKGWRKLQGAHRARFWNTVVYERDVAIAAPRPRRLDPARLRKLRDRIRRKKAA